MSPVESLRSCSRGPGADNCGTTGGLPSADIWTECTSDNHHYTSRTVNSFTATIVVMSDSDDESDKHDETNAFTCDDLDDDESDKSLAIKRCYNGGDESAKSLARTATCSFYRDCNLMAVFHTHSQTLQLRLAGRWKQPSLGKRVSSWNSVHLLSSEPTANGGGRTWKFISTCFGMIFSRS